MTTNLDAIWAAFDTTDLAVKITALLVVGVGVQLLYMARKHIRRAGSKI